MKPLRIAGRTIGSVIVRLLPAARLKPCVMTRLLIVIGPPSAFADRWARRFADPVACFASGWMRIRQRARQRGVELPLVISDHADWDELTRTIEELKPREVWITHGREDALMHWCMTRQIKARELNLVGDLLMLTRITAGTFEIDPDVDVGVGVGVVDLRLETIGVLTIGALCSARSTRSASARPRGLLLPEQASASPARPLRVQPPP